MEGVKEREVHRQKLATTHLISGGYKWCTLSAHTKHSWIYLLSSFFGQRWIDKQMSS